MRHLMVWNAAVRSASYEKESVKEWGYPVNGLVAVISLYPYSF